MKLQKYETIDAIVQILPQNSFEKLKAVLSKILDGVQYLTRQALPLCGLSDLSANDNCGNFLETSKLLNKYNPVANQHLHKVQQANSCTESSLSLSPQCQNEFRKMFDDHICLEIFQRMLSTKYFALTFDSTLDISHSDQMSQVI